jgi:hypothetical protein
MLVLSGCDYLSLFDELGVGEDTGSGTPILIASEPLPEDGLWLLVHPTDAPPAGPGIVHIDGAGVELARLPLPAGVTSPHGLAYDGSSLWLTEFADPGRLFQLDPVTGDVISMLDGVRSGGVALDGDGFWVDMADGIVRIDAAGVETQRLRRIPAATDLAFDGTDVLVLANGSPDSVTRLAPDGTATVLPHPATRGNEGYAMALRDDVLLVVDHAQFDEGMPYRTPVLRTLDPLTGEMLGTAELPVEGWITAIAP